MKKTTLPLLLLVTILITSCSSINSQTSCQQDSDCVPAACCHVENAVNKEFKPNCDGVLCSMECAPNTLDCGQGKIKCIENQCQVVIYNQ